jgi:phosphatidylserine/phosphatidylglycerophosphate/cardiolipin synthase-like enzyme
MLVADGERGYVGSVNFSRNSTQYAREVGLLFTEPDALAQIAQIFEHDWQVAQPPAAEPPADCPRVGDEFLRPRNGPLMMRAGPVGQAQRHEALALALQCRGARRRLHPDDPDRGDE